MDFQNYDYREELAYEDINDRIMERDNAERLDGVTYWTEELIKVLYGNGDTREVEFCLEELCAHLEIELPCSIIQIEKKKGAYEKLAMQLQSPLFN